MEEVNMATWTWEKIPHTSSYGLFKTVINEEKRDMRMKCKFNLNLYYMPQIFHPISYCNFSGLSSKYKLAKFDKF